MPPPRPIPASRPVRLVAVLGRHRVLASLMLLDLATKSAAWHLLPEGHLVEAGGGLRLMLSVNRWGVMGGPVGMEKVVADPAYTLLLAAGLAVLALVVWRLGRSRASFPARLAAGVATFGVVAVVAEAGAAALAHREVPDQWVVASIRASVLALAVSLYVASRRPLPRAVFTLLAAGALANAASYLYPPWRVVDFLVVPLWPFAPLLGAQAARTASDSIGVVNVADLYLFLFPVALLAWPLLRLHPGLRGTR